MRIDVLEKPLFLLLALLLNAMAPRAVLADEMEQLGFTAPAAEEFAASARLPRPTSRVAENVTVITAEEISRINAHTLSDVLQSVPGIELDYQRTPSTFAFFNIQGALNSTVLVLVDGVRQNDFDQNMATPGQIPVQQIERIEIIKGAASASWGSALGGVINIITKSPAPESKASGMLSGSIGSRFTADSRAELSGTVDRFGYYLNAGNLRSDGLTPNTAADQSNLYGKLTYLLPSKGKVTLGFSCLDSHPGLDEADTTEFGFVHDNSVFRRVNGFLKFSQPLYPHLFLDVDGYLTARNDHTKLGGRDPGGAIAFFNDFKLSEATRGSNSRLTFDDGKRSLVTGVEYGHVRVSSRDLLSQAAPFYDLDWDSWALYANAAYTIGELTILPGIRYDSTGISGDSTSYTLGATYRLAEETTLRAYAAQGYSLPTPRAPGRLQKIRTVQGGIESGAVPYLWLKGTYFFNTLRHSESAGEMTITNQIRQGFEIEARTAPLFGLSLVSGYTYLYAKDSDTGEQLKTNSQQTVPPHLAKLALKYDSLRLGVRGTLSGNYVFWNGSGYPVSDRGMIWDLHLDWKIRPASDLSPQLFLSGHNLFNGNQTVDTTLYNTYPRWFEGGVRLFF